MSPKEPRTERTAPPAEATKEESTSLGGRSFLVDEEIRNVAMDGQNGYLIRVCLTSYRSLPLSCIEKIELRVDGTAVEESNIRLVLNGHTYKLNELARLSHIFWFILDYADLFVASEKPLKPGELRVEGTLVTVEPYVTGGRFSFFNTSTKRLVVAAEL